MDLIPVCMGAFEWIIIETWVNPKGLAIIVLQGLLLYTRPTARDKSE